MIGTNDTQKGIPLEIYEDNLRQIIGSVRANGKTPIVATLPKLGFTPLYLKNNHYILKYNDVIHRMSKKLDFVVCDMAGTESYYIDNVHYTHEGYNILANRFATTILNLQKEN